MNLWSKNTLLNLWMFIVPILSILALVILFYIPRINSFFNLIRLAPFFAGIYFWQTARPDAFNIFSAFILGIFADTLSAVPLGMNILVFLLYYRLTSYSSSYFNVSKFTYAWLLFFIITLLTYIFKWAIASIFYRTPLSLNLLCFEFMVTATLYPLITRYYTLIERKFIPLEERYEKV